LLEPDNPLSNTLNAGVEYLMDLGHYTTIRRGEQGDGDATGRALGDNSFYRDNADWMPGWGNTFGLSALDPNGHPSGATAQDRATNYVGQSDPTGVWSGVRENLVTNESAAITAARSRGDTNISFGDVYDAHVDAYAAAPTSTAANPFIDPASFALAMYGAPLIEHLGINEGPITGASIDMFNDPTDSVGDGWAKRMGLAAGEVGVGAGLTGVGAASMMSGDIVGGAAETAAGIGMMGLGAFSATWNTATAIDNGMSVGDAASGITHVGGEVVGAGGKMLDDAARGIASWF
jgi:hypothetical protein